MTFRPPAGHNDYPATPQHDKLKPHQEAANTIGQFLEWLDSTKYFIAEWVEDEAFPAHRPIETWIGEYFGIDAQAYHAEKDAVLEWWRSMNRETT